MHYIPYYLVFSIVLSFSLPSFAGPFDNLKESLKDVSEVSETRLNLPEYSPLGKRIANGEAVYEDTFFWINTDGTIGSTSRGWSRVPKQSRHLVFLDKEEAKKIVAYASISPEERKAKEELAAKVAAEKKAKDDKAAAERKVKDDKAAAERKLAQAEANKNKKHKSDADTAAGMIVFADACVENFMMKREHGKTLKDHSTKEIKDLISKNLVTKEYANSRIKYYKLMTVNLGYQQKESCDAFSTIAVALASESEEDLF
jgi:hypothetical protein